MYALKMTIRLLVSIIIILLVRIKLESREDQFHIKVKENKKEKLFTEIEEHVDALANEFINIESTYEKYPNKVKYIEALRNELYNDISHDVHYNAKIINLNLSNNDIYSLIDISLKPYVYETINSKFTEIYERKLGNTTAIINNITENIPDVLDKEDSNETVNIINDLFTMTNDLNG